MFPHLFTTSAFKSSRAFMLTSAGCVYLQNKPSHSKPHP
uniref:Uncharacterized protein n=1 Tax=Anguilla anguilla TaxID=7936 RepID=A0A0E9UQZ8_ANGAN